ncbi:MAG TPA: HEAT repeat domain-containing protein [Vicinamibacterales bacterium]|nr:HEAT repeat domain-containing protein [Vicinamibacterales bacterium]
MTAASILAVWAGMAAIAPPGLSPRPAAALVLTREWQPAVAPAERRARRRAEDDEQRARAETDRARERDVRNYERAQRAIERDEWAQAVAQFQAIAAAAGARADAALYWKAYALDKLGQRAEALTAVADLTRAYPQSRWLNDARALEVQVRQRAGQAVALDATGDEELKLLALNALQHSAPDQAVPLLRRLLLDSQSLKLKERALFVLAQGRSPEAREVLEDVARHGNPDLQRRAIDYLGVRGSDDHRRVLADVYRTSPDVDVKRRVLRAYMVAGDRSRVLEAATSEPNEDLRSEAVRQLGVVNAHEELWQLYQKESAVAVKRQILQAMFIGGNATRLIDLARTEPEPDLRRTAVRNLGLMQPSATGAALAEIYSSQRDTGIRRAAVQGLFVQNNAEALVALARKETDPAMKKELVQRLSLMKAKVALDYLMEVPGK